MHVADVILFCLHLHACIYYFLKSCVSTARDVNFPIKYVGLVNQIIRTAHGPANTRAPRKLNNKRFPTTWSDSIYGFGVSFPFPFWAFGTIPFLFWAARSKYSSGSNPQIGLQAVQPDIICHLCIKKLLCSLTYL